MKRVEAERRTTIADVAKAAKVSVGTVSHVLSGQKGVSKLLRRRVEAAMEALDYVPNIHAQGLKQARSKIVGLCLPHGSTSYMSDLANEFEAVAEKSGYSVLHVFGRHRTDVELTRVRELARFRIDGIVVFPSGESQPTLDFLRANSIPTVLIDRTTGDLGFDQITLDNARAMQDVVEHLAGLGHRRLLFIFKSSTIAVTQERLAGLRSACQATAGTISAVEYELHRGDVPLREQIGAILAAPIRPTAIIVSNSQQAASVIVALRELGIRIPDEISLVSFDETEWCELLTPPLSTVRQPARQVVRLAWQLVTERIAEPNAQARIMSMRATFIPRGSVASPKG